MARDGEIQNRSLLQAMSDFLNIGGVKRAPPFLDTNDVKAVYVLGQQPGAVYSLGKSYPTPDNASGSAAISLDIAGSVAGGVLNPFYKNDTYALDLVGLDVVIDYDADGATADNNVQLTLYISRYQNYGSFNQNIVMDLIPWQTVVTGKLNYRFSLGGFVRGADVVNPQLVSTHVPAGDRLQLVIGRLAGGTFPANTMVTIQAHAFTSLPQPQVAWNPAA